MRLLLLALYARHLGTYGLHLGPHHIWSITYLVIIAPVVAGLLAWITSTLSCRERLPVLSLIESWKTTESYAAIRSLKLGLAVGIAHFIVSYPYAGLLKFYFGPSHPKIHPSLHPLEIAGAVVFEEILFRGAILSAAMFAIRRVWETPITYTAVPFWIANFVQAALFGFGHRAYYTQLADLPLQIRLFLYSQTWSGLVYGWLRWRYGLEVPMVAHGSFDFLIVSTKRFLGHAPRIRIV